MGTKNVIISMGKDGAMFVNSEKSIHIQAPKGALKNSVGAGDSIVAEFVYGTVKGFSYEKTFKIAIACSSATAFSYELAAKKEIEHILSQT